MNDQLLIMFCTHCFVIDPLKGHYQNVAHARTSSVYFHQKTMELSLCCVISTSFPCDKCYLYPTRQWCSCKKNVSNNVIIIIIIIIIINYNNNKMSSQQDQRIKEVSETYFNLSMAVWFCWWRFLHDRLVCCLTDLLTKWTYWLNVWLTNRWTDWRLTDGLTDLLTDWWTDGLTDWLTDGLTNWLTDWLNDWLTDWLTD